MHPEPPMGGKNGPSMPIMGRKWVFLQGQKKEILRGSLTAPPWCVYYQYGMPGIINQSHGSLDILEERTGFLNSVFFHLVHIPDFAGSLMADHAGSDRFSRVADFTEKLAVGWLCETTQDLIAHAG